jgi:NADPH-dependent 2,4-dienoyl-CoA reductase/sulfur reductase-like enzyme
MDNYEIVVIGGGPAGMAAAVAAREAGVEDILLIERDRELGGILQQCIHNGFGLHHFKEDLTGPEFSERYIRRMEELDIPCRLDTTVLQITANREILYINAEEGVKTVSAGAIVLAMGCRERSRGAVNIPGSRPAGVFTAGTAQRLINIEGYMVGRRIMMLGTGDIGLIMARRLTLEGAKVIAVLARKPYPGGLMRNVVQCLYDYDIPLMLRHTIVKILGKDRVTGVLVADTDENSRPIPGSEELYECDTVILSVGLIPENELSLSAGVKLDPHTGGPIVDESRQTSTPGIYACGNVVHVHDLVDFVVEESEIAGRGAAGFVLGSAKAGAGMVEAGAAGTVAAGSGEARRAPVQVLPGEGLKYVVPQRMRGINGEDRLDLFLRVNRVYGRSYIEVKHGRDTLKRVKRLRMNPGEMERLRLNKGAIEKINGSDLIVKAVDEDG